MNLIDDTQTRNARLGGDDDDDMEDATPVAVADEEIFGEGDDDDFGIEDDDDDPANRVEDDSEIDPEEGLDYEETDNKLDEI